MNFNELKSYPAECATSADTYYYLDCDVVAIKSFVPSRLDIGPVSIAQDTTPDGQVCIYFDKLYCGTLAVLLPDEYDGTEIKIDGSDYYFAVSGFGSEPKYALIAGPFDAGCRVTVRLPKYSAAAELNVQENDSEVLEVNADEEDSCDDACTDAGVLEVIPGEEFAEEEPLPTLDSILQKAAEQRLNVTEAGSDTAVETASFTENSFEYTALSNNKGLNNLTALSSAKSQNINEQPGIPGIAPASGALLYNPAKARYILKLKASDDIARLTAPGVTFTCDGYEQSDCITIPASDTLFSGHRLSAASADADTYTYDLVIMRPADNAQDCSAEVHAYTDITGSFSGETCYCVCSKPDMSEPATHGSAYGQSLAIDPVTGYKWGKVGEDEYIFELENGGYSIDVEFVNEGCTCKLILPNGKERKLIASSAEGINKCGAVVKDGSLRLAFLPADCLTKLVIRAIDTIAETTGYALVAEAEREDAAYAAVDDAASDKTKSADASSSLGSVASDSPASNHPRPNQTSRKTNPPQLGSYMNAKLKAKKASDTAKTIGIATGVIAAIGGLMALLKSDD